jgi:hypothetical protein
MYQDDTEEGRKSRRKEFVWAIRMLQAENQRQRSLPDCPTDHWGWIPDRHDRVNILTGVGGFAEEMRPSYFHAGLSDTDSH